LVSRRGDEPLTHEIAIAQEGMERKRCESASPVHAMHRMARCGALPLARFSLHARAQHGYDPH
jgi:hypothetical protein